ncbi:hypothetical protein RB620_18295 [Paenibacillus sp. LHD-117]|nr:hypothetical protein [Paenibacillus sp. LHD-117]MDQ6421381.1 hypothetical protein [Paenibacillus sp. LHD-117]
MKLIPQQVDTICKGYQEIACNSMHSSQFEKQAQQIEKIGETRPQARTPT